MEKYQIKPGYVMRIVVDEYLAIPVTLSGVHSKRMILLNPVSALIWECLSKAATICMLTASVTEEFDISYDTAQRDICDFLAELEKEHLIYHEK